MGDTEQRCILHLAYKRERTFQGLVSLSILELPDVPFDTLWAQLQKYCIINTRQANYNVLFKVRCLPIGPHLGVPDVLVLGISRPYLSTHQQNGVPRWHCTGRYPPLASHFTMDHHGPLGLRNWCGIFIETTGCSCLICRSFWHVVLTPAKATEYLLLVWCDKPKSTSGIRFDYLDQSGWRPICSKATPSYMWRHKRLFFLKVPKWN